MLHGFDSPGAAGVKPEAVRPALRTLRSLYTNDSQQQDAHDFFFHLAYGSEHFTATCATTHACSQCGFANTVPHDEVSFRLAPDAEHPTVPDCLRRLAAPTLSDETCPKCHAAEWRSSEQVLAFGPRLALVNNRIASMTLHPPERLTPLDLGILAPDATCVMALRTIVYFKGEIRRTRWGTVSSFGHYMVVKLGKDGKYTLFDDDKKPRIITDLSAEYLGLPYMSFYEQEQPSAGGSSGVHAPTPMASPTPAQEQQSMSQTIGASSSKRLRLTGPGGWQVVGPGRTPAKASSAGKARSAPDDPNPFAPLAKAKAKAKRELFQESRGEVTQGSSGKPTQQPRTVAQGSPKQPFPQPFRGKASKDGTKEPRLVQQGTARTPAHAQSKWLLQITQTPTAASAQPAWELTLSRSPATAQPGSALSTLPHEPTPTRARCAPARPVLLFCCSRLGHAQALASSGGHRRWR
jgi:hypothetical protein